MQLLLYWTFCTGDGRELGEGRLYQKSKTLEGVSSTGVVS